MLKILFIVCCFPVYALAQQALPAKYKTVDSNDNKNAETEDGEELDFSTVSNWGLYGIGNLNTEAFNNLNAGGKISGFKRLYRQERCFTTIYFSMNRNAANNNDSLLAGTFLFPDIGSSAIALTLEHNHRFNFANGSNHIFGALLEFSNKSIRLNPNDTVRHFSTLNYSAGVRYMNSTKTDDFYVVFGVTPYLAMTNVPDEDNGDYRYLFKSSALPSAVWSVGTRFLIQINNFQAFADLRHVLGSESKLPIRELRGFTSNIGFVFNAEVFEK